MSHFLERLNHLNNKRKADSDNHNSAMKQNSPKKSVDMNHMNK